MTALIWKELRGLRAHILLFLGITLLFTFDDLIYSFPDRNPLTVHGLVKDWRFEITLVFALMIGPALLIREADEGTISFLDGLPISRTRVFLGKAAGGFFVLLLFPVSGLLFEIATGLLSRTSVDPALPWSFLGIFAALTVFATVYVLAIGLLFTFLRQWLILASGVLVWAYFWLSSHGFTWHEWLNPNFLFSHLDRPGTPAPWLHLSIQVTAAAVAFFLAWVCFCRMGVRTQDTLDAVRQNRLGRFLLSAGRLCAPLVWIMAISFAVRGANRDNKKSSERPLGEDAFAKYETANYEFLFREGQRDLAKSLFDKADPVFASVAEHLNAGAKERIIVDLASQTQSHAAAVTNWTRIRYPLFDDSEMSRFERVLAHETAHVLTHQLSGSSFNDAYNSTRFFNEGYAHYLDHLLYGDESLVENEQRLVAAIASRERISFDMLCNNDWLSESWNPSIVYPLGAVFCQVLTEIGGKDAPARLLKEFDRSGLGRHLQGTALWRAILQNCNLSLDTVVAAYDSEIDRILSAESDFVSRIPRLTAKVEIQPEEIRIIPSYSGESPGEIVCKISYTNAFRDDSERYRPDTDGVIHISRKSLPEAEFRYLLGWKIEGLFFPVFEKWQKVSL